ncbi:MAG TPA: hypothetical protein VNA22_01905 [Pyrinomonadaceae bacterium]|nr:hypothetical protein [Pyrinomonadaceae bacterium]
MRVLCLIVLFSTLLLPANALLGQCVILPAAAEKAEEWDAVFTQDAPGKGLLAAGRPGWTGGDSTYSLLLPNGDTAFFFSDSYIAESPTVKGDGTVTRSANGLRTTEINCIPPFCDPPASVFSARNSIVVLDRHRKSMRTLVGPKGEQGLSTSYFKDPADGLNYWMGDVALLPGDRNARQRLFVFLHKFDGKLQFHGAAVSALDPNTLKIERTVEVKGLPNLDIHWGTGMIAVDGWLYIYGKGARDGKKQVFVARTKAYDKVEDLAASSAWSAWNGKSWTSGLGSASPIIPAPDSISDEFNVVRLNINGRLTYVFAGIDTTVPWGSWRDITLYSSCSPQGPFTGKHFIYRMPEADSFTVPGIGAEVKLKQHLVVYNPHSHPQFTRDGRLLISYNLNRTHNADTIYIDGYRPRFVWVPIAGLKR